MFVLSMKTTRPRVLVTAAVIGLLLVTLVALSWKQGVATAATPIAAGEEEQRQSFLQGLGYEVQPGGEVREILIPAEFDEAFSAYNALQQETGMDLSAYRGRRVKYWTYTVTNYPGSDTVQAHLYVYKDRIVGGDVASTAQNGFRHGLKSLSLAQASEAPAAEGKEESSSGTAG